MKLYAIQRSRSFNDLVPSHSGSILSYFFSSITAKLLETNFHVGQTKVCLNGPCHMTKVAAMPIYGKNFKNLLFQNRKANDLRANKFVKRTTLRWP